jgi:hypothetical protein
MKLARIMILAVAVIVMAGSANALITFDEYGLGTVITNQYAAQGVLFSGVSGSAPIITMDGALQVVSPNPPYAGDFEMTFINPVDWVEFDAGYWDTRYSGDIRAYDAGMNVIGTLTNQTIWTETGLVYEHFTFTGLGPIAAIYFNSVPDPAGAAMDNLDFSAPIPEPATIALVGLGLLGLGARLRKRS